MVVAMAVFVPDPWDFLAFPDSCSVVPTSETSSRSSAFATPGSTWRFAPPDAPADESSWAAHMTHPSGATNSGRATRPATHSPAAGASEQLHDLHSCHSWDLRRGPREALPFAPSSPPGARAPRGGCRRCVHVPSGKSPRVSTSHAGAKWTTSSHWEVNEKKKDSFESVETG